MSKRYCYNCRHFSRTMEYNYCDKMKINNNDEILDPEDYRNNNRPNNCPKILINKIKQIIFKIKKRKAEAVE